jgi:hypothetical protein
MRVPAKTRDRSGNQRDRREILRNNNNETGVTIDKKELKEKTQEAVKKTEEAGGKVLDKTGKALREAADNLLTFFRLLNLHILDHVYMIRGKWSSRGKRGLNS